MDGYYRFPRSGLRLGERSELLNHGASAAAIPCYCIASFCRSPCCASPRSVVDVWFDAHVIEWQ